jgi:putative ABC transport system ATP-binding protein
MAHSSSALPHHLRNFSISSMRPAALIEARGITRRDPARGATLLAPTDFVLEAGSRIALTGPSGAGKSVFMRALALLDPLDGGQLLWQGKALARAAIPEYRRHIAYVRQRPAAVDGTVEDLLRFPYTLGVYRGEQFDRARVEALVQAAGRTPEFLAKRARDLSGGEAQIAALLRVLQLAPEVLLLDEPTAALDPDSARSVEALVAAWFDAQPTERAYMWISHDLAQATRVCRQHLIMTAGHLQAIQDCE